jgi:hypothetical protein
MVQGWSCRWSAATVSTAAGYPGSRAALSATVAAAFWPLMLLLVSAAVAVVPMG